MANERTIMLSGTEQEVKISGQNCDIRNDGVDIIYASRRSSVVAGEDGVLSVPAGQAAKLLDTGGRVYLLGTGSVMLCGNDYSELVFKSAATSSGEGGTVDQTARNTINAHANNTDIHLTTEDAIEAAATAISNPNLLINPDFKINQRGQAEYSRVGYTVDMWRMYTNRADGTIGAVTLTGGYVDLTSNGELTDIYFSQYIENGSSLIGRIVTLSFKASELTGVWGVGQWAADNISVTTIDADGIASVSFVWQKQTRYAIQFFNRSSDAVLRGLEWVKLELGSVATPFTPPDPATELAKCQRYFYAIPFGTERFIGHGGNAGIGYVNLPLPTTMRIAPTISNSDGSETKLIIANGNTMISDATITQVHRSQNGVTLAITSENITNGQILCGYHQRADDNSALAMYLSAEL